jgi:ribose 5-phosphate isomerase B
MLIAIASDHNGFRLKAAIVMTLESPDYHFVDLGPFDQSPAVDYVDYAKQLAMVVADAGCDRGILVCGTGVGMSIVANRQAGVRAALVHNDLTALKSREHNDANVLCLGAWVRGFEENIEAARIWLTEPFGEHRHVRRVERIDHDPTRIVMANGVFDILHVGHIEMLKWAKSLGSWLVVALNDDGGARLLKGRGRPVNGAMDRKAVLESMRFVDEVIVFEGIETAALIEELRPDVVVKGAEWTAEQVRDRDGIPSWCGVKVFPVIPERSTTKLIERIRA